MDRDDEKWVQNAQENSRKAFDKLVRKYVPLIFRLLYDLTGNYEDAQDLTQETFLRAYLNIRQYRGTARVSTWLYRIAYNVAIDFRRREKKMLKVDWGFQERLTVLDRYAPDVKTIESEEGKAIEVALQKLTRPQRLAVILSYYHGFRMREIGEVLECSESTVRVHLFRALHKLQKELKHLHTGE